MPSLTGNNSLENTNSCSRLVLEERHIIHKDITNGSTKTIIAQTISKEIKAHCILVKKCPLRAKYSAYRKCHYDRQCTRTYTPFFCPRHYTCNGCPNRNRYCFNKNEYNPDKTQAIYQETMEDSRVGINFTSVEPKAMGDIISPLLRQGLFLYQILHAHPNPQVCGKVIYNYIESNIFHEMANITVTPESTARASPPSTSNNGSALPTVNFFTFAHGTANLVQERLGSL